jgi:catechol 2,3-dioxygenase-like lactoylglutathione lyase family enzyme
MDPAGRTTMPASLSPDLFVTDIKRSVDFYKKALGLEEVDSLAGPDGPFFSMLSRDGFRIMLESPKSPGTQEMQRRHGSTPRATVLLYVSVDDLGADERRLKDAGVAYEGPTTQPYGMREVSFQDPDGYAWAIGQRVG